MKRGSTLIELMITVALIGVAVQAASWGARSQEQVATAAVQRERALALLEYEADVRVHGGPADAAVQARLTAELPDARFEARAEGPADVLVVTWKLPDGLSRGASTLTVLRRSP